MNNAKNKACKLLYQPLDSRYDEEIRIFQGCPTIAISKGGRIFLGWYSGGWREPHMENYNLLIYSDDLGKSWSKPVLVIPSSKENKVHALDIQLWKAPDNRLYMFWVQNNTLLESEVNYDELDGEGKPLVEVDGYVFNDFEHSEWVSICDDPDADEIKFSEPRYLDKGFLRCKPLVLDDGRWMNFNYDQNSDRYGYSISEDEGKTYTHYYGGKKIQTMFDETMAYQRNDGSIRMFARTKLEEIAESISYDGGKTWTDGQLNGIPNPNTRFYISKTPSNRVLMINNDHRKERTNMCIYLSDDDGKTWKYKRCIDTRAHLSYPDVDFYNGRIYLTYDRERGGEAEILFLSFTEEDIMNDDYAYEIQVVSKPVDKFKERRN